MSRPLLPPTSASTSASTQPNRSLATQFWLSLSHYYQNASYLPRFPPVILRPRSHPRSGRLPTKDLCNRGGVPANESAWGPCRADTPVRLVWFVSGHALQACRWLRFAREAHSSDLPAGHLFRDLHNLATQQALRRRFLLTVVVEDYLRLPASGQVPTPFLCPDARACPPAAYARQPCDAGASHSAHQRRIFTRLWPECGKHKEVWQRGFTDHRIRDAADFERHREYIHDNPVVRRLAERAEYRYCSSYPGFKLDSWPAAATAQVA